MQRVQVMRKWSIKIQRAIGYNCIHITVCGGVNDAMFLHCVGALITCVA